MKKMIRIIALLVIAIGVLSFEMHKFYVSIADVKHNETNNTLEFAVKVFTDDLEKALQLTDEAIRIDDQTSMGVYKEVIANYLNEHIALGEGTKLKYLGAELNFDVAWLYLESEPIDDQEILMRNSLFTDVYPEQVNVVNLSCKNEVTSYLFHTDKKQQQVKL